MLALKPCALAHGARVVRPQRRSAATGRPAQREAAQCRLRHLGPRLPPPDARAARRRGRLDARLAATAVVVLAPAALELAPLPGLVLCPHDPEDEVEQPD